MNSRRTFLQRTALAGLALPMSAFTTEGRSYSLDDIVPPKGETGPDYWRSIRMQFPLKEGQTYFNNGTLGPMPGYVMSKVIEQMHHSMVHAAEVDYKGEGPNSGPGLLSGYFEYRELREKLGAIINADYKEISLTQNATFGMNFVANGLELKAGDELINTNLEHGGGYAAWKMMAKRKGCTYKQVEIELPANDPQKVIDAIVGSFTDKTRVLAIPHIVSAYGIVMPVKEICAEARKRGIFTILDGAQCVGQVKVDVKDIGCDAYYSSLHKWLLAPAGNGILYLSKEVAPDIWSTLASYRWDDDDDHGFRLQQYGTGNPAMLAGVEAAVDFYNTIGPERWLGRISYLADRLRDGLKEIPGITIHSPVHPDMCAGMTSYALEGYNGPQLQKKMWEMERLQPRSVGTELLRHCCHIYNLEEEVDRSLEVLKELAGKG